MKWRLIDFDALDGYSIQTVYEAVAKYVGKGTVPNTINLCYPESPYVCIGVHQEVEKEVDLEYCEKKNLPIIRRNVGGGTVYLDDGQQFYHVIVRQEGSSVLMVRDFFKKYLQATVYAYRKFGLPAEYKPINDVVINGRKASGNGAATIYNSSVLIGNIIMDLNVEEMARIIRAPSEKFRDKLAKTMQEWMTSLKRELGYLPDRRKVKEYLIEGYQETLDISLEEGELTSGEERLWREIREKIKRKDWLYSREKKHEELLSWVKAKCVKVAGGIMVCEATYKGEKMLRITLGSKDDVITDILISGDFFLSPPETLEQLEEELRGTRLEEGELKEKIQGFMKEKKVDLTGIRAEDIVKALMDAKKKIQ